MLVGASSPVLGQSSAPLQLRPVGAWTADFAEDTCALRRSFTDGATTVVFEMKQVAPGDDIEVAVASATLDSRDRAPRTQFLPGDSAVEARFWRPFATETGLEGFEVDDTMIPETDRKRQDDANARFIWPEADRDQRELTITGYSVERAFEKDLVIRTGPLHETMKVMRACLDDLVSQWGLDPTAQRTLSRAAAVDFDAGWVSRMTQLQTQLIDRQSPGSVRARLLVDEAGKVSDCRLLNLPPDTNDAREFCGEMEKRAQLIPALDNAGQPVKSFYIWQVVMVRRSGVTTIN